MKAQLITFTLFLASLSLAAPCPYEQLLNGVRRVQYSERFLTSIDKTLGELETALNLRAVGSPSRQRYRLSRDELVETQEGFSEVKALVQNVEEMRPQVIGFHPELEKIHDALVLATESAGRGFLNELRTRKRAPDSPAQVRWDHIKDMVEIYRSVYAENNKASEENLREMFGDTDLSRVALSFSTAIHELSSVDSTHRLIHGIDALDAKESVRLAAKYGTTVHDIQRRWSDIHRPNILPLHVQFRRRRFTKAQAEALLKASLDLDVPAYQVVSGLSSATRIYFFRLSTDPHLYMTPEAISEFARVAKESRANEGLNLSFSQVAKYYFQTEPPKILDQKRLAFIEKLGIIGPRAHSLEEGELPPDKVIHAWKRDSSGLTKYDERWKVYRLNRREWARSRRLSQNSSQ